MGGLDHPESKMSKSGKFVLTSVVGGEGRRGVCWTAEGVEYIILGRDLRETAEKSLAGNSI